MKHATSTIPDDLDEALAAYGRARGFVGDPETVAQAALRESLEEGTLHLLPFRPFRITPIEYDDGDDDDPSDVSINHDKYFADWEASGSR